ncbi:adenylate/guanylate cyclase domain-containing protein, partial [Mycolicibacterium pulveris]
MASEAIPIGRISAFVRWVARTPWPVFTLGMLQADIIGALLVVSFLRFGLPPEDR